MSDAQAFGIFLLAGCVPSFAIASLVARHKQAWSRRKVALLSAAPLPALAATVAAFLLANALFASMTAPEACGADACGMAMMIGSILLLRAAGVYLCCYLAALLAVRLAR